MAAARRAEAGGLLREAISLYSAANRCARDAGTERRLLGLRSAEARARAAVARADWPPVFADPFPGLTGLPEVMLTELDVDVLGGAILHHGAVLVRNFATEPRAAALRDAIDQALAAQADPGSDNASEGWHTVFEADAGDGDLAVGRAMTVRLGGGLLAVDSPRAFFLYSELVSDAGFTDLVATYLGEEPVLSANKTTFRRLREAPRPAWHQDGSFMGDVRAINLWLSLSHCGGGTDTLGLDVIPHRVEEFLATGTDGAPADVVAIGQSLIDRTVAASMITPEFHPGDALCFDDRFLHRTSEADATGLRHAIEAWFFAPSHFPEQYGALAI